MPLTPEEQEKQDQFDFYIGWACLLGVIALGAVGSLIYHWTDEFKVVGPLIAIVAVACWFIYAFTGDPYRKRTNAVILSYFFVIGSLLLLTVPTFGRGKSIGAEPMGIVSGCVLETRATELQCIRKPEEKPTQPPAIDDARASAKTKGAEKASGGQKPLESRAENPLNNQWLINIGGVVRPQESAGPVEGRYCGANIPCGTKLYVSGGIAVPLYFVVLGLIGGAISLSRRVPEIQKRSEKG